MTKCRFTTNLTESDSIWSEKVLQAREQYERMKAKVEEGQNYLDHLKAELDRLEEEEASR